MKSLIKSIKPKDLNLKTFADISPIVDWKHISKYDSDVLITKGNGVVDIFQISTTDLFSQNIYDTEFNIIEFSKFFKVYNGDLKIIKMTYPVDTTEQINFIKYKMSKTTNEVFLHELNKELELLKFANETASSTDFYLMIFAKNEDEYLRNMSEIYKYLIHHRLVFPIEFKKKLKILFKLNNLNSNLSYFNISDDIPQGIDKGYKFNYNLLSTIQSVGGISCKDERIVTKSDGYEACIEIYKYKERVEEMWLTKILNFENSICTIDISPADRLKTINSINRSMEEQASRYTQARYTTEKMDAQKIYDYLQSVYEEMTSMGEVMKNIITRIYLFGKTREELEKNISRTLADLEATGGFAGAIYLEENERQLHSLHISCKEQVKKYGATQLQPIPSETLALGHPYHFSQLIDPYGKYLGNTTTGGLVFFDSKHKDKKRLSYNGILFGTMSSGKSTTLKNLIKYDIITGNYVRGYATNNEFDKLVKHLGGKIINLDGTDGIINILHIYKTTEDETNNFTAHISKVKSWYKTLCPEADTYDLATLGELLKILYEKHLNYTENTSHKITGLPANNYPILSDFLEIIKTEIAKYESQNQDDRFRRIENIQTIIKDIINNYCKVFNGYSDIEDFSKEKLVMFSVQNLKNFGDNVFNAQMYSSLSLLFDNLIQIGLPQKEMFDVGNLSKIDTSYYQIYIDEAHEFVNTRRPNETQFIVSFEREARKYFGGVILATQNLSDMIIPTTNGSNSSGVENIKKLFELSQYKFIFKQDSNCIDLIEQTFKEDLPISEVQNIPKFEVGECMLVISGLNSLHLKMSVSNQDLELFSGGA